MYKYIYTTFYLVAPILRDDVMDNATEGMSYGFDLAAPSNSPFPPSVVSSWTYNGVVLVDSSDTSLTTYNISFDPVNRNHSGEYQLVVSNDVGSSNATLSLNVQCKDIYIYLLYSILILISLL